MVFSIPSYLCTGDRPKRPIDERARGATFLVSRPKTGVNPDALFDKEYKYLWNGVRTTTDPEERRRRDEADRAKKWLTPNGFVYTSRTAQGTGLGSYFGCFQASPYAYIPPDPQRSGPPEKKEPLSRGIYTSPAPKGSYGTPNLAISDIGAAYVATFYDQGRNNARAEREALQARMPTEPFKPCGRLGFTFDEALATGTSRVYAMTVPFRPKREPVATSHFRIALPWRPAGHIPVPPAVTDYWEDPYGGFDPRVDPKDRVKKPSEEVFLPSSRGDHFWYTQSIVFKRL